MKEKLMLRVPKSFFTAKDYEKEFFKRWKKFVDDPKEISAFTLVFTKPRILRECVIDLESFLPL